MEGQTMRSNAVLWTIQGVLAALFVVAGGMKLVLPAEQLVGPVPLPILFMRFIGVVELLGGLGLVLPGLLHIREDLTPLAAWGLVVIMIGATVITLMGGLILPAVMPAIVGVLLAFVASARRSTLPLARRVEQKI
jgi:uncharacterized membrane protein YphA (DoxX/SURF4 family)